MRKAVSMFLSTVLIVGVLAGCGAPKLEGSKPAATPGQQTSVTEPVKVGLTISLSGGTADMGEAAKDGAEIAIKEINAKGGVLGGRPLQLVPYDDEVKAEKGLENVKRLIEQDKVVAFLGPANTGVALAQIDYVQQAQVLMLVSGSAGTPVTQKYKDQDKNYTLRLSMVDSAQAPTIIDFLVKNKGYKKIAILHDTTAYGTSGMADMTERLKKHGITPVAVESFKLGDTDLTAQVNKAKAAGADAIATYALAPELAQIMKALQKVNWKPVVAGSWTLSGELFHKLAGDLVENEVYTVMSVHPTKSEKYKAFDEKMQKAYGRNNFAPVAAQSYDSIYMIANAIEKAKSADPKAIRDAVEATESFAGVTNAPAKPFAKGKPEAIGLAQMFMGKWVKGKLEPVPDTTVKE